MAVLQKTPIMPVMFNVVGWGKQMKMVMAATLTVAGVAMAQATSAGSDVVNADNGINRQLLSGTKTSPCSCHACKNTFARTPSHATNTTVLYVRKPYEARLQLIQQ